MADNNQNVNQTLDKEIKKDKRKKAGIIVGIVALFAALAAIITGVVAHLINKKNKNKNDGEVYGPDTVEAGFIDDTTEFETLDSIERVLSVEDLGADLAFPTKNLDNSNYGEVISNDPEVTIDVDKLAEVKEIVTEKIIENGTEKVIEKENTIIYINEEAKEKAENIGKVVIDDKNGTITIDENGKAKVTEEGYEIVDESGNVVETGNSYVPEGYVEDITSEFIKEEDLNDIVMIDNDIWVINNGEPTILFNKYDYVTKEAYNKIKLDIERGKLFNYKPDVDIAETTGIVLREEPVETDEIDKEVETTVLDNIETEVADETTIIDSVDTTTEKEIVTEAEIVTETEEVTTNSNIGVVNEDGTYTIHGETFRNYETFLAIADNVDIINIDGIWWLVSDYEEYLINSEDYEYIKTR